MTLFIGTSGWQYPHWRGTFYPDTLPASRWLEFYAESCQVVEVNNTFYRLPEANVFQRWAGRESRDDTWFCPEIEALLGRHGAALCVWDREGVRTPLWRTADWGYVRFHEGSGSPRPCYGTRAMGTWARRIAAVWPTCDVFAFFNNDANTCAIRDAVLLARAADRLGLARTRVPEDTPFFSAKP